MAATVFERTIQIWDLRTAERLSEFDSVYGFGGHRITLSPAGKTCVAAAWNAGNRGGVACYDAISGAIIWHRTDIRHTQSVRFSGEGGTVWCGVEDGKLQQLDARNGETIKKLTGIKSVFDRQDGKVLLLNTRSRNRDLVIQGRRELRIPKLSFGLLHAAFGPDSLCMSEAGGPVRCVDAESGVERWRYEPPGSSHVLRLSYRAAECCFYGVQWEYERGTLRELVRFSADDGHRQGVRQLGSWEEEFCMNGDTLVTSGGEVISVSDGIVLGELAFPQTDYPDDPITV